MSFAIRTRLAPKSIRTQLTLWYLLMLSSAIVAFAVFVFISRARTLYREADADLEVKASHIATELRPELLGLDVAEGIAANTNLAGEPFAVLEPSGRVVFRSPAFPALDWSSDRALARAAGQNDSLISVDGRNGGSVRVATIIANRTGAEPLAVQVAESTGEQGRALGQLALAMALFFAIVVSMASYGGSFIARRALAPVDAIVDRVRAIQANQLETRLPERTGSEELDRLANTLNGMLDRIEGSMRSARRFAADASHELQTPLAAIRAALEMSTRAGPDDDDRLATIAEVIGDLDRVSALIRDLRLLALADAGHLLDRVEMVDLSALAADCAEIARVVAEPRQIHIDADIPDGLAVRGSELHLRRVVVNLLANAVRYSAPQSSVQLSLARRVAGVTVSVADTGCGIGAGDLPHIFERFYRADPARARDTGGTGLGLAIADQIVRSHRGRIEVTSQVDQGSTFTVFLPSAASADPPRPALAVD